MKIVGDKLAEIAMNETDAERQDLFGRSAFNRYYYSVYWISRRLITKIKGDWKDHNHKDIPNILNGDIKQNIVRGIVQAVKQEVLEQSESDKMREKVVNRLIELAELITVAHNIRVVADYEPDKLITNDAELALENSPLASAGSWEEKAMTCHDEVLFVWEEIGNE